VSLFSKTKNNKQIGVEFLISGVAIVQVQIDDKQSGRLISSELLPAVGREAQALALQEWVHANHLQKCDCVCLISADDFNIHQVEKPKVEESELLAALSWRVKDLIGYEIGSAVVDFYPMPISNKNNTAQLSVVTAQDWIVAAYVDCIKSTGLNLVAIDVPRLVGGNLKKVQQATGQTLAVLSLNEFSGYLNIYHDTDLYVSRDFKIGTSHLAQVTEKDEWTYDSLLLEMQRSMDYFESYYGLGSASKLLIFPQISATEKLATYLRAPTNYDINFIVVNALDLAGSSDTLESHCFQAYGAALRGVRS
jgi:MSHA biogenesis protein MshI